ISINTHPQSRIHYRLAARIIGAPVRISHCYEGCGVLDRFLVNRTLQQDYERHTVENNLDILPLLGKTRTLREHRLELFPGEADRKFAAEAVSGAPYRGSQRLGIHIGSGGT